MLQLILNGESALLKKGTSFKMKVENQLFSEQGEYSMQVSLPLRGCPQNQRIFGQLHRTEYQGKMTGNFVLQSEILSNSGKFRVTGIDESEVKIQLMAKKSLSNFECKDEKGNEIYIDELDLGFFYDEWDWNECPLWDEWGNYKYPPKSIEDYRPYVNTIPGMSKWTHEEGLEKLQKGYEWEHPDSKNKPTDGFNCILLPVLSITDNKIVNDDFIHYYPGGQTWKKFGSFCFQPTLVNLIKRIVEKGLHFRFRHNLSVREQHIYMASMVSEYQINKILPHWTIKEFLKEVSNFFDCKFKVGEGEILMVGISDFINETTKEIDEITDEYSVNIQEEEKENFSASGNVDYEWPVKDDFVRLDDEVWEKAKIKEFANSIEMAEFVEKLGEDIAKSQYLMINVPLGETFALLQNDETKDFVRARVDWFGPLIRNEKTREIQTKLRIVPIRLTAAEKGNIMSMEESVAKGEEFSVNNYVKPESDAAQENEQKESRDVIEVFYWDKDVDQPLGTMVINNPVTGLEELIPFENWGAYMDSRGPFVLQNLFKEKAEKYKIDTKKEYVLKFIEKEPMEVDQIFLIKNQKYICKKLEYDINEKGVNPLVTGYFYKVD